MDYPSPAALRFYVASALENAAIVREYRRLIRERGGVITCDWTAHGSVQADGSERIAEVAAAEVRGVISADRVIVVLPGGRGTHTELGIAIGRGIPVAIVGPLVGADGRECAFYRAPGVVLAGDVSPEVAVRVFERWRWLRPLTA